MTAELGSGKENQFLKCEPRLHGWVAAGLWPAVEGGRPAARHPPHNYS